ncbi:hypothetical protein KJ865_09450, partial [Myxococcota bacterium]|nr:hypothetical protein [Myxococcota bacterium]
NYSRKGTIYVYQQNGYILLSTSINYLVPGMALSAGSYGAAAPAAFAISVSDMQLFWRSIRREVRALFGPLRHVIKRYVADLKWVSLVAHAPKNGVYEFTGFKRFVSAPKSFLAKAIVMPKTADRLSRYVAKDARGLILDGMAPAIFSKLVSMYNKHFEAMKRRDRRGKYKKPLEYLLKQGQRANKILGNWTGYHAASLRVVKGKFLVGGALSLKDTAKGKETLKLTVDLVKDILPTSLAKILPPSDAPEMRAFIKHVTFKNAAKRFGKLRGATISMGIKWSEKFRRIIGCSRGEMELMKMLVGNRVELSMAQDNGVILYALGSANTGMEIARLAKANGALPDGYKPRAGLSYSGIYGLNFAGFFGKIIEDGVRHPAVKKHPALVSAAKQVASYLKKYNKGNWSHGTLGTKGNMLMGNLTFGADCIRIPSALAYLAYEAQRAGFRF